MKINKQEEKSRKFRNHSEICAHIAKLRDMRTDVPQRKMNSKVKKGGICFLLFSFLLLYFI